MTHYRGFDIDPLFRIFHNGRQIFTAFWQLNDTLEQAQRRIDASLTLERIARNRPSLDRVEEIENGSQAWEDHTRWVEDQAEREMIRAEND